MKDKWHNQIKILNYITSTDKYKVIFILSIFLALYGAIVLSVSCPNFIDAILIPFQFYMFNIFAFSLLFANTLNISSLFKNKFSFYVIRLENKKNYIKETLKTNIIVYSFHFLIILLLFFMALNLSKFNNNGIHMYNTYTVSNLSYTIFYLLRYYIIGLFITLISSLIYINFNEKATILLNIIFLTGFIAINQLVISKNVFSLSIWTYFVNKQYSSFTTELNYTILFILILEIITIILYRITIKNRKVAIS